MQNKRSEATDQRYLDVARIKRYDPLDPEGNFSGNAVPGVGGGGGSRTGSRGSGGKAEMSPGQTQYDAWSKDTTGRTPEQHSEAWNKFNTSAPTPGVVSAHKDTPGLVKAGSQGETSTAPEASRFPRYDGKPYTPISEPIAQGIGSSVAAQNIPQRSGLPASPSLSVQGSPQLSDVEERNRIRTERQARTGYVPTPNGPGYGYYKGEDLPPVGSYMNGHNGLTEVTPALQEQLRTGTAGTVSQGQYPGVKPGVTAQGVVSPARGVPVEGAYSTNQNSTPVRSLPEQGMLVQPAPVEGRIRMIPSGGAPMSRNEALRKVDAGYDSGGTGAMSNESRMSIANDIMKSNAGNPSMPGTRRIVSGDALPEQRMIPSGGAPVEGTYTTTPTGTSFTPSAQGIGRTLPEQNISAPAMAVQGATSTRTLPEQGQTSSSQGMQFNRIVPGMQGERVAEFIRPDGASFFTNNESMIQGATAPKNLSASEKQAVIDSEQMSRERMRGNRQSSNAAPLSEQDRKIKSNNVQAVPTPSTRYETVVDPSTGTMTQVESPDVPVVPSNFSASKTLQDLMGIPRDTSPMTNPLPEGLVKAFRYIDDTKKRKTTKPDPFYNIGR